MQVSPFISVPLIGSSEEEISKSWNINVIDLRMSSAKGKKKILRRFLVGQSNYVLGSSISRKTFVADT